MTNTKTASYQLFKGLSPYFANITQIIRRNRRPLIRQKTISIENSLNIRSKIWKDNSKNVSKIKCFWNEIYLPYCMCLLLVENPRQRLNHR